MNNVFNKEKIAIIYHLHFPDLIPEVIWYLSRFPRDIKKYLTVTDAIDSSMCDLLESSIHNVAIIKCENLGRDLKVLLELIQAGELDQFDLVLKVHGKKSSHRRDGHFMRRNWSSVLAPERNPFEVISNIGLKNKNIRLVAPVSCLLYPAEPRNWVSNLRWCNEIFERLTSVQNLLKEDCSFPILTGSFYWLTKVGIRHLKRLPISSQDWLVSSRDGVGIDGRLEHAIERLILFNIEEGELDRFVLFDNTGLSMEYDTYECFTLTENNVNYQLQCENVKNNTVRRSRQIDDFLIHWTLGKSKKNRTNFQCLFYAAPEKLSSKIGLELRINGLPYHNFFVDSLYMPLYLPGLSSGVNSYSHEFYGELDEREIEIGIVDRFHPLKNLTRSHFETCVRRASYSTYQNIGGFISLENVNLSKTATSRLVREASSIGPKPIVDRLWDLRQTVFSDIKKHIFIINNSFSAICASRIINDLHLNKDCVLIIYHRLESSPLIESDVATLKTNFPDYEFRITPAQVEDVTRKLKEILDAIAFRKFALYSYHYYGLFPAALAWSPLCVQANLLEEGNLNSRYTHELHRVSNVMSTNCFPERVGLSDARKLNLLLYQAERFKRLDLFAKHETRIPEYIIGARIDSIQLDILSKLRRDYFYHPKMAIGYMYFRLTPWKPLVEGFTDPAVVHLQHRSKAEIDLSSEYRTFVSEFGNRISVAIVLPSASVNYKNMLEKLADHLGVYSSLLVTCIPHPAGESGRDYAREIKAQLEDKIPHVDILWKTPKKKYVSDLLCMQYDLVLHYGSSIALSVTTLSAVAPKMIDMRGVIGPGE